MKQITKFGNKLFSNIYGFEELKAGLTLALLSGIKSNILLIGDPGSGKTALLRQSFSYVNSTDYFDLDYRAQQKFHLLMHRLKLQYP